MALVNVYAPGSRQEADWLEVHLPPRGMPPVLVARDTNDEADTVIDADSVVRVLCPLWSPAGLGFLLLYGTHREVAPLP